jgi:hypothetical protein
VLVVHVRLCWGGWFDVWHNLLALRKAAHHCVPVVTNCWVATVRPSNMLLVLHDKLGMTCSWQHRPLVKDWDFQGIGPAFFRVQMYGIGCMRLSRPYHHLWPCLVLVDISSTKQICALLQCSHYSVISPYQRSWLLSSHWHDDEFV